MQNILNNKPKKIEMKKSIFILFTVMIALNGHTQNKKEVIEILNLRIDSCLNVIESQNVHIIQLSSDLEKLKTSETKIKESIQLKENELKNIGEKNNQLSIENNQLKEKITALENPPINLSGKYRVEIGRFGFPLEIFDYKDSGFSFKYESWCKKGGEVFGSFGEGQAIKNSGNKFTTKGNVLDDASGENFQIEFVMTETGIDIKFICGINDAFCWENGESLSLVKGE